MAIRKKYELEIDGGIKHIVDDSYIKIICITGNKQTLTIEVAYFISSESDCPFFVKTYSFVPNMDSNFIKQGYEYLKTLPEFQGAEDC